MALDISGVLSELTGDQLAVGAICLAGLLLFVSAKCWSYLRRLMGVPPKRGIGGPWDPW